MFGWHVLANVKLV